LPPPASIYVTVDHGRQYVLSYTSIPTLPKIPPKEIFCRELPVHDLLTCPRTT
jgi:hypothetical protein